MCKKIQIGNRSKRYTGTCRQKKKKRKKERGVGGGWVEGVMEMEGKEKDVNTLFDANYDSSV